VVVAPLAVVSPESTGHLGIALAFTDFCNYYSTSMSLKAIVKSVISGDSLILRGRPGPQGQPPKERVLHLADVTAPRLGSSTREDEPWAFESREFLRAFTVGKEISFTSTHSLPSSDDVPRDLGNAEIGVVDLASELLRNGWAKLKEIKREPTDEDLRKRELENEAKASGKGLWNPHGPQVFWFILLMSFVGVLKAVNGRLVLCITRCPKIH